MKLIKNKKSVKSAAKAVKNTKKGRGSRAEKLVNTPEMMITALASEMAVNNVAKLFKMSEAEATKRARKQLKEQNNS